MTSPTLYLSLLRLDPMQRHTHRLLADGHALHGFIMSAFPISANEPGRSAFGILHRLEAGEQDMPQLLVQSLVKPQWENAASDVLAEEAMVTSSLLTIPSQSTLRFRLDANPTIKCQKKRVPLRTEDERRQWLARKLDGAAEVADKTLSIADLARTRGRRQQQTVSIDGVRYEGLLTVVDAPQLARVLAAGLGPGKAYGMGLLSLAPAQ